MDEKNLALDAIRKKLIGKKLNYNEIFAIMDEISKNNLDQVMTTYFAASGYSKGFSTKEIYYLTKAMIETGEHLEFKGIVADKHSIGGVPGTRTTLIVVPIVAAAGFTIPKSSSRAITTPGGTADDMEVIAPVTFTKKQIYSIVEKTGGCVVWGGSFHIAPADDILIKVEEPLMFESFDKILVSIMAKKIAFGSNHIVIDLPYGANVKVHNHKDAQELADKFVALGHEFGAKMKVLVHKTDQPAGQGVGPVLETREALKVLEQLKDRPLDLEEKALNLAGTLLELCLTDASASLRNQVKQEYGDARDWAKHILSSGKAHQKMQEIIHVQGGDKDVESHQLKPGKYSLVIPATHKGTISEINSKNASIIAKILGAPHEKKAGMFLEKKINDTIEKGEPLLILYSQSEHLLQEAAASLSNFPVSVYE